VFQYSLPLEYFTLHFDISGVADTTVKLAAEPGVSLGYVASSRHDIIIIIVRIIME